MMSLFKGHIKIMPGVTRSKWYQYMLQATQLTEYKTLQGDVNPFNPKLIMQILPTIEEEND